MDSIVARFSALKSNLEPSLEIFADVVLNPAFPQADFAREQKQQLAAIEREKSRTRGDGAARTAGADLRPGPRLFGAVDRFGHTGLGLQTHARGHGEISRELVQAEPCHACGGGRYHDGRGAPQLEKLFAAWKPGDTPKKNVAAVGPPERSVVYLMDRPGSQQSIILAGGVAPPRNDPAEISLATMNNILGGDFGSRINMNLREDKHWSYGSGSMLFAARGQRPFLIYAPVETDKTKESLAEVNKELRGIRGDRPVTAEELARVQASETLRLPGSRETIGQVQGSIQDLIQYSSPTTTIRPTPRRCAR